MSTQQYRLGTAELEVLTVLWALGPTTVREVLNQLRGRGRRVAYTTVQTLLTRLERKGFVKSDKSDLAHVFRASITRDRDARARLRTLLAQMYDGEAGPLVLQLVRTERLTPGDIEELQKLIDRLESEA